MGEILSEYRTFTSVKQRTAAAHGGRSHVEYRAYTRRPELVKEYEAWLKSRTESLAKLNQRDAETVKQAWQRFYFQGRAPDRDAMTPGHSSKLRVAKPIDKRKRPLARGDKEAGREAER